MGRLSIDSYRHTCHFASAVNWRPAAVLPTVPAKPLVPSYLPKSFKTGFHQTAVKVQEQHHAKQRQTPPSRPWQTRPSARPNRGGGRFSARSPEGPTNPGWRVLLTRVGQIMNRPFGVFVFWRDADRFESAIVGADPVEQVPCDVKLGRHFLRGRFEPYLKPGPGRDFPKRDVQRAPATSIRDLAGLAQALYLSR